MKQVVRASSAAATTSGRPVRLWKIGRCQTLWAPFSIPSSVCDSACG
jgi:hypothetical protein